MKPSRPARILAILLPLLLFQLLACPIQTGHASGTLYSDPRSIVPQNLNTTFDILVRVAGMDQFNAWDIQVSANVSVIVAVALLVNTTGNVFGRTAFEVAHCVNGRGSGCSQTGEGPGIVHSSVASLGGTASGDGLLFTITYKVVGMGYSRIRLYSNQNDAIVLGGPNPVVVQHTTVESDYGTPPPPPPDFLLSSNQTALSITQGQSNSSTIELQSSNGFSGTVSLNFTESIGDSTQQVPGLHVSLNASTVFVSTIVPRFVEVTISTTCDGDPVSCNGANSTPVTQITVTITGQSGTLFHPTDIVISMSHPGDFGIDARPGQLRLHARDTGNSTIILWSKNKFSGEVELQLLVIPIVGPPDANATASLSTTSLRVDSTVNATAMLTVKTPFSILPFHYDIMVTATIGRLSHSIDVIVLPPSPNFNFTVNPGSTSVRPGSLATFNITLTSTDYFQNTVYLYASALSGTKLSFSPASVALKGQEVYEQTLTATLNVTTDPTLSVGLHQVFLTASASDSHGTITHSLTVNVTIELESNAPQPVQTGPKNIFGLDPLVYFAVIGALAVGLAAITVLEVRRGRRATSTLQERMHSTQISRSAKDPSASEKK